MWWFGLVLVGMLIWATPVHGQALRTTTVACAPQELQDQHLRKKYKEVPIAQGPTSGGALAELWVSKENDTWTFTLRLPSGQLCLLATGYGWRKVPAEIEGIRS